MHSRKLAIALAALAAVAAPTMAEAKMYDVDETGGATPQYHDDVPDPPEPTGQQAPPTLTPADATTTIPTTTSSCTYRVTGRLVVRNPRMPGMANNTPLEGVRVKVSGRSNPGWYNAWDTVTTDADGEFTVTKSECGNRGVKVQARFESDDLRVTSSQSQAWYQLHETDGTIGPSTLDLGNEPLGGESGEQATPQARTDAQTWIVYDKAMDHLRDIGHPMLQNTVKVHNPATLTASDVSAADPILHDIHIASGHRDSIDAMLHELGHIWAYPRVQGEGCLTWDAITTGGTHSQTESPCVAFNEGFAEVFGDKLELELIADGEIASDESALTPWNRAKLLQEFGIGELRFEFPVREDGWQQLLRMLLAPDITALLFGEAEAGTPASADTYSNPACAGNGQPVGQDDLSDLLQVIGDENDQMDVGTISVEEVMDRAETRLASFDANDNLFYTQALDPELTGEPHHSYRC
jgi:hypothetical protein